MAAPAIGVYPVLVSLRVAVNEVGVPQGTFESETEIKRSTLCFTGTVRFY